MPPDKRSHDDADPIEILIDGTLDLHTFHPRDLPELLDAYIEACQEKQISPLRIIHGKGIGTLRDTLHARLKEDPRVVSFQHPDANGNWGVTIVLIL